MSEPSPPAAKRLKTTREKTSPTTVVTWNCNGFTSRAKWDTDKLRQLLTTTEDPDMICLQEARLKACGQHQRGRPMQSEYDAIQDAIKDVFRDYQPVWSLADTKYAGTLTLVHKRLALNVALSCAFSTQSAIDLLLGRSRMTRREVGIAEPTCLPQSPQKKQTSMKSFFAPKKTAAPVKASSSNSGNHNHQGRFQFFSFPDMDVLQTYVPNNGVKEKSFQKRRDWDAQMLQFLKDRRKLFKHLDQADRPLLWCGDLNVAKTYLDGTHWRRRKDGSVYEWWTDETKCLVGGPSQTFDSKHSDDVGIPSFTANERRRFEQILTKGDLVDVWRAFYPKGVVESKKLKMWDLPNYTWRGHLGKAGSFAKYQGKGQRLDYFLLSPTNRLEQVESCEILGHGEGREGFCGSDHCPSLLKLKRELK